MNKLIFNFGFFAAVLILSTPAQAEVDMDAFQAAIDAKKSASEAVGSGGDEGSAVDIKSIDVQELFANIDSKHARIKHLQQLVKIAELEHDYLEVTGHPPEGAMTINTGGGQAQEQPNEMVAMLRSEIGALKRQINQAAVARESEANNIEPPEDPQMKIMKSDLWEVRGISIYGDEKTAIIKGLSGSDFAVSQGQEVGGVEVVSIGPESVRVREDGEISDIPLAGAGYTEQEIVMSQGGGMSSGGMGAMGAGGGWQEMSNSNRSSRNVDGMLIQDSTSR